jgi:hypothetical protein
MAQGLGTETGTDKTPGRRRRWRGRELAGLAAGIAAGLGIALAWVVPALSHPAGRSPAPVGSDRPFQEAGPAGLGSAGPGSAGPGSAGPGPAGLGPAGLDAEWLAYSDHSTCADWAGGDGVSAIRLNSAQLAWFFSDTSIGPAGPAIGFSQLSGFTHNSLVIQTTSGTGSSFVTMTGGGACTGPGRPGDAAPVVGAPPAVPGGPSDRYWAEDGLATGSAVIKFYNHYRAGIEPYVPVGTVLASYPVSQLSAAGYGSRYGAVARPGLVPLPSWTPPGGGSPVLWGAAVLRAGTMAYVYGTQSPRVSVPDRRLYLARVPVSELTSFAAWRFYAGGGRWAAGQDRARPVQPPGSTLEVSSGFSVIAAGGRYWLIQAGAAVGDPDIDAYPAAAPWGPFDAAAGRLLYRDPSVGLDAAHEYRIMYEARAEPALSASGMLMISYNVNSEAVTTGCKPMSAFTNTVILPRFVAVPMAAFGPGPGPAGGTAARGVTSGPPDYPAIVAQDPGQWFDAWAYPGDCPPVPAVASARAQPAAGQVTLSWPGAGLDISYRVYLRGPGQTGRAPVAATAAGGVTVTGLRPGRYQARVVPLNFYQHTGRAAEVAFTVP